MKHAWMYALTLVAVLSACHSGEETLPAVDLSGLEEIRIDFERTGWGSVEEHFTITPTAGGTFVLRGRYETRQESGVDVEMPLASNKVADFVRETSSPGWTRQRGVQVLAQGVDQRALRKFDAVIRVPPRRAATRSCNIWRGGTSVVPGCWHLSTNITGMGSAGRTTIRMR